MIEIIKKQNQMIRRLKEENRRLAHYAARDDMTCLFNRRVGMIWLNKEINQTRHHGNPITICFIDLDNLKQINDEFGHIQGDLFIQTFSRLLTKQIRKEDQAFRMGGDEFLIVFPHTTKEEVTHMIQRIQQEVDKINQGKQFPFTMSFSYGLCEHKRGSGETAAELIDKADKMMYGRKLKKKGSQ